MIYVHKISAEPIAAYDMIRSGGANVLTPRAKGKYLLLWNVEMVFREGVWHYIFGFDTRDTLEISPLARAVLGREKGSSYPNKADWLKWLGEDWEVISPAKREMLLGTTDRRRNAPPSSVVIEQLSLQQSPRIDWSPAKVEEQLAKARARKVVSHVQEEPQSYDVVLDPEDEGFVLSGAAAR